MGPNIQSRSTAIPKTKQPKSRKGDVSKPRSKEANKLLENIATLGGDQSDLDLVSGVRDDQITVGEHEEDPGLAQDVSSFLSNLKSGKNSKEAAKKSLKPHEHKPPPIAKQTGKKTKTDVSKPSPAQNSLTDEKTTVPPTVTGASMAKSHKKLVFLPNAHWYSATAPLPVPQKALPTPSASQISTLSDRAATLTSADAASYQDSSASTGNSASETHFLNTILSKGTLSDRLSALTLLVQASPVHNSKALESLRSMAERGRGKGGREEGLKAMRCVVDWWIGGGAPGRKLKYFRDQPLLHPAVTDQHLIAWYFEDWLKKYFFSILQILETYSLDTLPYVRTQALAFITTLLREKPEQEQNLLRLLVNKLGDTEKAVCSRASYHLLQVLQSHPNMKSVIVREVRALIFRPTASTSAASLPTSGTASNSNTHIRFGDDKSSAAKGKAKDKSATSTSGHTMERWNSHSWYYSAVTLNQVVLTPSDQDKEVARSLLDVYFEMFREILGGSVGPQEGNDAATNVESTGDKPKKKGKTKEVRGEAGFAEVEDANSRLISAVLTGVNRALPFAKVDANNASEVFKKHVDTLFLITHTSTFNISLQALVLILQITTSLPVTAPSTSTDNKTTFFASLQDRFYRTLYSSLADPRLGTSNKQAMYLNLLFKALKADGNVERVKAFVRRLIQVLVVGISGSGGVEFISGGLYLVGELFSTVPGLRAMFSVPASATDASDKTESYDPRKRDPQYAHASASPLYELLPLTYHYHPAVSLHARQLLFSQPVTATPDLSLNTLGHFLDRFVYKNPKKPKAKGASAMQPSASSIDAASGVKLVKGENIGGEVPVNDEKWWRRRLEDVPVDEIFFHKYFTSKNAREKAMSEKVKKRKTQGADSDLSDDEEDENESGEEVQTASEVDAEEKAKEASDAEEDSDVEEAEIWKAMKATMPAELQDDDLSDDSDDLPSGLDELEDNSAEASEDEDEQGDEEIDDDDDDALSLVEDSDAEDLIPLDDDVPDGLIDFDETDSEDGETEEWGGIDGAATDKKRKRGEDDTKSRRKKLRSLPTFASYEDYAKLIEDGPEENI